MRILWFRVYPIVEFGGTERLLLEALRFFRGMGVQVKVLLTHPVGPQLADYFSDYLPNFEVLSGFANQSEPGTWLVRLARFAGRVKRFRSAIRAFAPDVIVANEQYECRHIWIYSLGGIISVPPTVAFIHGSPFQFAFDKSKYALSFRRNFEEILGADSVYRELIPAEAPAMSLKERIRLELDCAAMKAGVRKSRKILVLSQKNKKEVEWLYGTTNVDVICPGGFAREEISTSKAPSIPEKTAAIGRPIFLSVCRLIPKKRVDLLLKAFQIFIERNPASRATLCIGGTGREEANLRNLSDILGISERVQFLGFIPEDELRGWYTACDLFLSADNADYDLTVMSALREKRKIVVPTQYGIPPNLTSLRPCFFLSEATPQFFAETIEKALGAHLESLNSADLEELDSLSWESYFKKVGEALAEIKRV